MGADDTLKDAACNIQIQETILEEAARITTADRQRYYGHPLDNHECAAQMWEAYLLRREEACEARGEVFLVNARDVCMMNALQKISRDANSEKRDNLVDVVGYMRNAEQIQQEAERRANPLVGLGSVVGACSLGHYGCTYEHDMAGLRQDLVRERHDDLDEFDHGRHG